MTLPETDGPEPPEGWPEQMTIFGDAERYPDEPSRVPPPAAVPLPSGRLP